MHRSLPRRIPAALGVFLLVLTGCASESTESLSAVPESIIVLDIDTLRADHLGCYGYQRPTSPNIDALAAESMRFEWAFAQAPNTPPSQGAILSGLYPTAHGFIRAEDRMGPEVTTLAEVLAAADFATGAFVDGGFMAAGFGIDQGFERYHSGDGHGVAALEKPIFDWLEKHARERFLLLVHSYDVHSPYRPPEPHRSRFVDGLPPPTPGFEASNERLEEIRLSRFQGEQQTLPADDLAWAEALYDGGIHYIDAWIGDFMARVRRLGLDRRAVIVLLTDHGEEFQEHGSVMHEKLYATVTRIPLLIRFPGGTPNGTVSTVVEALDVMPTLLEAVGVARPAGLHGRSLMPLIRGEAPSRPALAFSESPMFGQQRSVANDTYRLQLTFRKRTPERYAWRTVELYAYRRDPLEQHDLAASHPEVVAELTAALAAWEELISPPARPAPAESR